MNTSGFWRGVAVALALSTGGAISYSALTSLVGPGVALRWLIATLALAYLLTVLAASDRRVGRVVTVVGWLLATGALALLDPSVSVWLFVQSALVWLVRSLYHYRSLWSSLADLALCGFALAAAVAAAAHSHSVFLSLWSFFLVQGLFVFIPEAGTNRSKVESTDRFATAHRAADVALRRLAGKNA